jgi:hypothetical protein
MSSKKLTLESLQDLVREVLSEAEEDNYFFIEKINAAEVVKLARELIKQGIYKNPFNVTNSAVYFTGKVSEEQYIKLHTALEAIGIQRKYTHDDAMKITTGQVPKLASDSAADDDTPPEADADDTSPDTEPDADDDTPPEADADDDTPPEADADDAASGSAADELEDETWKADPLGMIDKDYLKSDSTATYKSTARNKILQALRVALKNAGLTHTDITNIAALAENKIRLSEDTTQEFDYGDVERLYADTLAAPTGKINGKTRISLATKINQALGKYIDQTRDIEKAKKLAVAKRQFNRIMTRQKGRREEEDLEYRPTSRMPMTTTALKKGDSEDIRTPIDPVVMRAFEVFFEGKNSINERLAHLKEFSEAVQAAGNLTADEDDLDARALNRYDPEIIICGGNIMNMISRSTRQFDSAGSGYFAEAFLAFIVGGFKVGQEGGAGDFEGADGTSYSAKWGHTSKKQAASNFETGDKVIYVSAEKLTGSTGANAKISKTATIRKVLLHVYEVYCEKESTFYVNQWRNEFKDGRVSVTRNRSSSANVKRSIRGTFVKSRGELLKRPVGGTGGIKVLSDKAVGESTRTSTGSYDVGPPSNATKYELVFVDSTDQVYEQVFNRAIKKSSSGLAKALAGLTAKLQKLEDQAGAYSVEGDFRDAVMMAQNYKDMKSDITDIFSGKGISDVSTVGLSENKKQKNSKKDLDKLIKEVILKRLLK